MSGLAFPPLPGHSGWNNVLFISASGLRDASLRMDVVAHNVANSSTDRFVPDRVTSTAQATGGVTSEVEPALDVYTVQSLNAGAGPTGQPFPSQTDYATEGVSLLLAKHAFQASARAIKRTNDTGKTLIDRLG